ncbi:MAG TPA: YfhO family protein, partial [Anaerolineae bacterium]
FLGDRAGLMVLLFVLATVLVGAYLRIRMTARTFALLVIVFIAFDLFSINEPANKAAPYERYPLASLFAPLNTDESVTGRVVNEADLPGHFGIAYRVQDIGGISPLKIQRYDDLLKLPDDKVWGLLNVRWIVAAGNSFSNLDTVAREGDIRLAALRDAAPRAWMAEKVTVETDDDRALARIAQADFDPRVTAILSAPPSFTPADQAHPSPVKVTRRDAEQLTFDVTTSGDGILVVSENHYPGWRARVDGIETPVLRADVTLRAIEVRSGAHHIEMSYDPTSFKVGAGITVLTLISLAAVLLYIRRG